jgi:hypothetical protein
MSYRTTRHYRDRAVNTSTLAGDVAGRNALDLRDGDIAQDVDRGTINGQVDTKNNVAGPDKEESDSAGIINSGLPEYLSSAGYCSCAGCLAKSDEICEEENSTSEHRHVRQPWRRYLYAKGWLGGRMAEKILQRPGRDKEGLLRLQWLPSSEYTSQGTRA